MSRISIIFIILATFTFPLNQCFSGNESDQPNYHYVVIPGIIGRGGEHLIESQIIHPKDKDYDVTRVPTPMEKWPFPFSSTADFGQYYCQEPIHQTLAENKGKKIIIHASSQGTQSTLNTIARLSADDQKNIAAIVLESVMISGNSAIHHCVTNTFNAGGMFSYGALIGGMPFGDLLVANISKATFPNYNMLGQQAIDSLDKISKDIPIIIMHATKDKVLPYDGAIGVYTHLKRNGHNNIYLLTSDRNIHIDLLKRKMHGPEFADSSTAIQQEVTKNLYYINVIFKRLGLPHSTQIVAQNIESEETVIAHTQPTFSTEIYQNTYGKYRKKETRIRAVQPLIPWMTGVVLLPIAMFIAKKFMRK